MRLSLPHLFFKSREHIDAQLTFKLIVDGMESAGEIMAGIFGATANYYVTGVSAICFLITPLPMWLIDRAGRRPMLMTSA